MKFLMNNKSIQNSKMTQSGIYQLQCQCGLKYTRQFQTRFNEHKHNFKYGITDKSVCSPLFGKLPSILSVTKHLFSYKKC